MCERSDWKTRGGLDRLPAERDRKSAGPDGSSSEQKGGLARADRVTAAGTGQQDAVMKGEGVR